MDCPRVRYPQLNDVVEADLAEQGYQVLTDPGQQVDKVIQLYEVSPLAPCEIALAWMYELCCFTLVAQHSSKMHASAAHKVKLN